MRDVSLERRQDSPRKKKGVSKMKFGIMTALITPMKADGTVNEECLVKVIEDQLAHGVHSLLALGGTGENMAVPQQARRQVLDIVVKTVNKRVPVVAGVVELGVYDAIRCARMSKEAGVDALLVSTPFGAATSLQGCLDFFAKIDEAVNMPILIYNFPGRTGYNTTPDIVQALLDRVPNIIGIKECAEKFDQTMQQIARFGDRIEVLSGNEYLAAWEMLIGAKGAILASSNLLPGQWVEMYDLAQARKADELTRMGMKYHPLQKLLFKEQNPGPLKYAMSRQGFDAGSPLLPVCPISKSLEKELDDMMEKLGVL